MNRVGGWLRRLRSLLARRPQETRPEAMTPAERAERRRLETARDLRRIHQNARWAKQARAELARDDLADARRRLRAEGWLS